MRNISIYKIKSVGFFLALISLVMLINVSTVHAEEQYCSCGLDVIATPPICDQTSSFQVKFGDPITLNQILNQLPESCDAVQIAITSDQKFSNMLINQEIPKDAASCASLFTGVGGAVTSGGSGFDFSVSCGVSNATGGQLASPSSNDKGSVEEDCPPDKTCLKNPIKYGTDIKSILGTVIKNVMGILGSITLAVFVYGGFLWLTSAGNSDRVKKGTETMAWAAIGVFIIFSAYAILSTIIKGITG